MKFMNKKRFGSTVMAGALALSLAAPAFAANNTSTTITGGLYGHPHRRLCPHHRHRPDQPLRPARYDHQVQ